MKTITLAGQTYEVKVSEHVRFIKYNDQWLKSLSFVEQLAQDGRWNELNDLARIGIAATGSVLTFGSAQSTANQL